MGDARRGSELLAFALFAGVPYANNHDIPLVVEAVADHVRACSKMEKHLPSNTILNRLAQFRVMLELARAMRDPCRRPGCGIRALLDQKLVQRH